MDIDEQRQLWNVADTLQRDADFLDDYRKARAKTLTIDGARRHIIREAAKDYGFGWMKNEQSNYLNAYFNHLLGLGQPTAFVQAGGDRDEFVFYPPYFSFSEAVDNDVAFIAQKNAQEMKFNKITPTKEPTMLTIKTITYVNGNDVSTLSDDQIFTLIAQTEKDIKGYEAIENKPKKLEQKIQDMKDAIGNLIMLVDDSKKNGADSN